MDIADPILLARLQFAFTIAFHILFPAFSIGIASYLLVLELWWLRTADRRYRRLFDFWLKLFALSFTMGVVSGIVMSYQLGMNWSRFSAATGNVLGPLMAYEVFSAFFLEASFLGILLFGRRRVSRGLYLTAVIAVAAGTVMSAFWILAANSWMHTPAGFVLEDGVFIVRDWLHVIFNPSMPYRFVHMMLAAYLATGVVVAAVGAFHTLRRSADRDARLMLRMALPFVATVATVQLVSGHAHGVNVHRHQPAKLAAIEGHWNSYERDAPLVLFGLPDAASETNHWQLSVPIIGSVVVTGSREGAIEGLRSWPADERPPVAFVFWAFRIMAGIGLILFAVGWLGAYRSWRGDAAFGRRFLHLLMALAPAGFVALLAGWVTAEVGRQPYVVYGLLRTSDAASPISGDMVGLSALIFAAGYPLVFGAGTFYMLRVITAGTRPQGRHTHD